jgi:hypothetical protein
MLNSIKNLFSKSLPRIYGLTLLFLAICALYFFTSSNGYSTYAEASQVVEKVDLWLIAAYVG